MGRYRTVNVDLNRQYRNDLNQNFTDIEKDIIKAESEIARVEVESKERDNFLAGTDVEAIINRIDTSASNAELQSIYAKNQGDYAKTQGDHAKSQGDYALTKGNYADEKAILADEAAANANLEASNLSQLKIDVTTATQNANMATESANTSTTNANAAATYATTQGDYAKAQGDAAKSIVEGTGLLKQTDIGELVAGFNTSGQVLDRNGNVVEGKVKKVNNTEPDETGNITISIPSKTSELTNDSGFLTNAPVTSVNGQTGDVTIEANVPDATTSQKGIVQLSTSTSSTSTTQAATPNAVKQVNDKITNHLEESTPHKSLIVTAEASSQISTTSTSFVDMTSMLATLNITKNNILVFFSAEIRAGVASTSVSVALSLDGGAEEKIMNHNFDSAGANNVISFNHLFKGLNPGNHTIKARWMVSSNNAFAVKRSLIALEVNS